MSSLNTSATGGYLLPDALPAPLQDDAFQNFLQEIVVGITGLDGELVRPRWQLEPPNLPTRPTDWAAIGVSRSIPDFNASTVNGEPGEFIRHETNEILVSFYGPNSEQYAGFFRDGLQVEQNRAVLFLNGMGLLSTGDPIAVPSVVKERWLHRIDLPWSIRRQIRRSYQVLTLLSAQSFIDNEKYITPLVITQGS